MRIDSGLGSHYYHNRLVYDRPESEDSIPETAASPRTAANPAVSSTLLSPSLASALWVVEGGRKPEPAGSASGSANVPGHPTSAEQVEALYREFDEEA